MYQCLKCKKLYKDEEAPLIKGCNCGSHFFLLVRKEEDIKKVEKIYDELVEKVNKIEKYEKEGKREEFGVETIRIMGEGIYEINLDALMSGKPIIVLSKKGSYIISLPSIFGYKEDLLPEI